MSVKLIGAFPKGFVGALSALDQGKGISELESVLQPTIDVQPYIGLGKRRNFTDVRLNPSAGGLQITNLALNEVWHIRHIGGFVVSDATGTLQGGSIAYLNQNSGVIMPLVDLPVTLAINSRVTFHCQPDLMIGSGENILIYPNVTTTANVTWNVCILYDLLAGPGSG